jgi:hypothetical protein
MNALLWLTPELSTRVCVTLLHSLWQVAALAAIAWLVGRFCCKRNVERAYAVHVAALLLSFVCVSITFLLTESPPSPTELATASLAETPVAVLDQPAESSMASPRASNAAVGPVAMVPPADRVRADAPPAETEIAFRLDWAVDWRRAAPGLAGFYVAGVGLMLIRLAIGIVRAERLRGRSHPVTDGPLADALRRLADIWSLRFVPALATAEHIVVPKVVGLVKPTILVPMSALTGLLPDEVEMILAHELAHVRRYDTWVNLVQRLAEAALFFNPALWVMSRRISSLREYCCDELACGGEHQRDKYPHLRYAQALLRVAELSQTAPNGQLGLVALDARGRSPSELRRRVARLFGEPLREPLQLSRGALLPLSLVVAVMLAQPPLNTVAEGTGGQSIVSANEIRLYVVGPNNDPIPDIEVEIRMQAGPTAEDVVVGEWLRGGRYGAFAKTDERGQLVIRFDEPPARLSFSVTSPGYGPYWAGWDATNHGEAPPKQFVMNLERAWTVGGIVTDEQGVPIRGARIRPSVTYKKRAGDREELGVGVRIESEADGWWQFASVPESMDALTVEVHHSDFQPMWITLSRDRFEIAPGKSLGKIELSKGLSVTGTVTDEAGAPIEGALISTKFANDVRKTITDKRGVYVLTGCQPRMARMVASAGGKALDMKEVRVDPEMQPVDFMLKPGGKVRVRVVDENGNGIPKARIFFQRWRGHIDYFEFDHVNPYADENGVWEWDEAPLDEFQADICHPDGMQLRSQPLIAREEEYVFSPPAALVVSGTVVDFETRAPIENFRVISGIRDTEPWIDANWIPGQSYDATKGKYRVRFDRAYPAHLVRIEANGYQVAVSRDIMPDEGEVDLDFELQRAADITSTIVTPSGEPAAGAKIALGVAGSQIRIEGGDIHDRSTFATRIEADADGRFSVPARDEPFHLVITHEAGFAHLTSEDGPVSDPITLTLWARVEGTFRVGPDPAPNVVLSMHGERIRSHGEGVPNITTLHDVTTAKDGKFIFERVFPGKGRIGRGILLMVDDGATEVTSSQRVSAEFLAGKTTRLDLGGTGRPVIGRLVPPPDYEGRVYWNFALVQVRANLKSPTQPKPPSEVQNDPEKYEAWWKEWKETTEGQAWSAAYETYERLRFEAPYITASVGQDGSFRIDDMPSGDYVLGVRFSKYSPGQLSGFHFTVPPIEGVRSDEILDLGDLTFESLEPTDG